MWWRGPLGEECGKEDGQVGLTCRDHVQEDLGNEGQCGWTQSSWQSQLA